MAVQACAVVLVKDFGHAKTRLAESLDPGRRRDLARSCAERALAAARSAGHVLVVAGSHETARFARELGFDTVCEERPAGQNPAARTGIAGARALGAGAVLLLSSDLPLVTPAAVLEMLHLGANVASPCAVAAAAMGRGGTNALYLRPAHALEPVFGADSLARFAAQARARAVTFRVHHSDELALDIDVPADLDALAVRGARP